VVQQLGGFVTGLKDVLGLKRKVPKDPILSFKRIKLTAPNPKNWKDNPLGNTTNDCMEIMRHSSPPCTIKSPCAFEGCLSKGFAFVNNFFFLTFGRMFFFFFFF
jgi:DCN1-like protein 1/2